MEECFLEPFPVTGRNPLYGCVFSVKIKKEQLSVAGMQTGSGTGNDVSVPRRVMSCGDGGKAGWNYGEEQEP